MRKTKQLPPTVRDVKIAQLPSGAWQWSYILGNKIVLGSVWRAGHVTGRDAAEAALNKHLAERGLSIT